MPAVAENRATDNLSSATVLDHTLTQVATHSQSTGDSLE